MTSISNFQILNKIGDGSFSTVYKVRRLSDSQEYAMKKVKMNMLTEKEKENALNEVRILASINSPYVISYKETFFDESSTSLCIVMELASEGDLQKKINMHKSNHTNFPEKEIWKVFIQTLNGLQSLHDMHIVHRDLKCANIFFTQKGNVKIGDLNVSKVMKQGLAQTQTGTPYYASPEVWKDCPYDAKSDMWGLGCVIYEMAALLPPFRANDLQGLYKKVIKGTFDRIPSKYSNDLFKMISLCLQVNPKQRCSSAELLKNEIIQKYLANESELFCDVPKAELLNTIKLPKNLKLLKEKLPKANYNSKEMENLFIKKQATKHNRIVSAHPKKVNEGVSLMDIKNDDNEECKVGLKKDLFIINEISNGKSKNEGKSKLNDIIKLNEKKIENVEVPRNQLAKNYAYNLQDAKNPDSEKANIQKNMDVQKQCINLRNQPITPNIIEKKNEKIQPEQKQIVNEKLKNYHQQLAKGLIDSGIVMNLKDKKVDGKENYILPTPKQIFLTPMINIGKNQNVKNEKPKSIFQKQDKNEKNLPSVLYPKLPEILVKNTGANEKLAYGQHYVKNKLSKPLWWG